MVKFQWWQLFQPWWVLQSLGWDFPKWKAQMWWVSKGTHAEWPHQRDGQGNCRVPSINLLFICVSRALLEAISWCDTHNPHLLAANLFHSGSSVLTDSAFLCCCCVSVDAEKWSQAAVLYIASWGKARKWVSPVYRLFISIQLQFHPPHTHSLWGQTLIDLHVTSVHLNSRNKHV